MSDPRQLGETIRGALLYQEKSEDALDTLLDALDDLTKALRKIDTSATLPDHYDPAEWWKHIASKRREIARDVLAKSQLRLAQPSGSGDTSVS